jgi:hypothetical protein
MNIGPVNQQYQTISDDQELAKVLAGVTNDTAQATDPLTPPPVTPPTPMPDASTPPMPPADEASTAPVPAATEPVAPETTTNAPSMPTLPDDLASIKKEAIGELRPLVDKLEVSPEEKFDTYLLLIRSTDDRSLIAPAHTAAQSIADETRRAQALLDIIKEIDFLSQSQTA